MRGSSLPQPELILAAGPVMSLQLPRPGQRDRRQVNDIAHSRKNTVFKQRHFAIRLCNVSRLGFRRKTFTQSKQRNTKPVSVQKTGADDMAALPLIVFDVNETLLDLRTMEPIFERIFGEKGAMRLWFANLILYSAALTVAGHYIPFTDIGSAVMKMLGDTRGIKISDADKKELTERFSTMPPHPEVPAALQKLRNAGFRLFTLSDNLFVVQTRQLEAAGIAGLFEQRFSADSVQHHKPSRQTYAYVEQALGVEPSQLCLIACHTWDTIGAAAAGWEAALIRRVGNDVLSVGPQPQIVGDDLGDVADQLIVRYPAIESATKVRA
jgi:2-haloacid dehalogenase